MRTLKSMLKTNAKPVDPDPEHPPVLSDAVVLAVANAIREENRLRDERLIQYLAGLAFDYMVEGNREILWRDRAYKSSRLPAPKVDAAEWHAYHSRRLAEVLAMAGLDQPAGYEESMYEAGRRAYRQWLQVPKAYHLSNAHDARNRLVEFEALAEKANPMGGFHLSGLDDEFGIGRAIEDLALFSAIDEVESWNESRTRRKATV